MSLAGPSPPRGPEPKVSPGRFCSLQVPVHCSFPPLLPPGRCREQSVTSPSPSSFPAPISQTCLSFSRPSIHSIPLLSSPGFVCLSCLRCLLFSFQVSANLQTAVAFAVARRCRRRRTPTSTPRHTPWSFLHLSRHTRPKVPNPRQAQRLSVSLASLHLTRDPLPPVNSADTGPTQTKDRTRRPGPGRPDRLDLTRLDVRPPFTFHTPAIFLTSTGRPPARTHARSASRFSPAFSLSPTRPFSGSSDYPAFLFPPRPSSRLFNRATSARQTHLHLCAVSPLWPAIL